MQEAPTFAQRMKTRLIRALRGDLAVLMQGYHQAGLVTWDRSPPQYVTYQTHKFSMLDAVETASDFCQTDYSLHREWLLVGESARVIFMTLPQMVITHRDGLFPRERGLTKLGTIGHRSILFIRDPKLKDSLVLFNENKQCVRIAIITPAPRPVIGTIGIAFTL